MNLGKKYAGPVIAMKLEPLEWLTDVQPQKSKSKSKTVKKDRK